MSEPLENFDMNNYRINYIADLYKYLNEEWANRNTTKKVYEITKCLFRNGIFYNGFRIRNGWIFYIFTYNDSFQRTNFCCINSFFIEFKINKWINNQKSQQTFQN